MNGRKFLEILPQLYEDWGQPSMSPKSDQFEQVRQQLQGNTSANMMQLLNAAVACLESGEVYAEIGCYPGSSLVGVLLNNPHALAYAVDNFSGEEEGEKKLEQFNSYLNQFELQEQVCVCEQNWEDFFRDLQALESEDKIGVYYYDAATDYRSILMALMLAKPFLADEAFIILSKTNRPQVQQAISDFISCHSREQIHQLLALTIDDDSSPDFGKGITILLWQSNQPKLFAQRITRQGVANLKSLANEPQKILLHVGCGAWRADTLPEIFQTEEWAEVRLDIDVNVKPDIIGSITDLTAVPDNSIDAVYSSHNLEHIYNYEVPLALAEFRRVLKSGGFVMVVVPDMQTAAELVVKGDMEDVPLYHSPAGDVPALWMFYGMGTTKPGMPYMAHKTGFTLKSLQPKMLEAGFTSIDIFRTSFNIVAYGYK